MTQRSLLSLLLLLLAPASLLGEVKVTSPLQGYWRAGKYFPLRVAGPEGEPIEVRGDGLLPVRELYGYPDVLLPMLVLEPPSGNLTVSGLHASLELLQLEPDERLIGTVGGVANLPESLFAPDKRLIRIPIDREVPPLWGRAIAWETLDAIVSEGPLPTDRRTIATLLGRGVVWAARSEDPPDTYWPWIREGSWWILRHEPAGLSSTIAPAAYQPAASLPRGLSERARRQVVLAGVLLCIVTLGATLLSQRLALVGVALASLIGALIMPPWIERQVTPAHHSGAIVIRSGSFVQGDGWRYVLHPRGGTWSSGWIDGDVRPVFTSMRQAKALKVELECFGERSPLQVRAQLAPGEPLAILDRGVAVLQQRYDVAATNTSPMQSLVRNAYLTPGVQVIGEERVPEAQPRWPAVFLQRVTP